MILVLFLLVSVRAARQQPKEITHASHTAVDIHGADGLGNMRPPLEDSDSVFPDEPASEFIYRTCAARSGEINLITLGPLTNIAKVHRPDPALASHRGPP